MTIDPGVFRVISNPVCRLLLMSASIAISMAGSAAAQQQKHAAPALAPPAIESLPGGASSVQETYGAWTVNCRIVENRKTCTLSQMRGNQQTGQRSFAIELRTPADGKTEGVLVLPFGLALSAGVKLALDEKSLGQTVPFSTCVPDGCLAPVSFPTVATDAIRKGKAMTITVAPSGGGEPVALAVGLEGFASALNRITQLAK